MLNNIIVIGCRVLIAPLKEETTAGGIILPQTAKKDIAKGFVVNIGPGYAIPDFKISETDEEWKPHEQAPQYVPLQVKENDIAIYLKDHAIDVQINGKDYVILPHDAILFVER